jgi:hypothetical protein
MTIGIAAYGPRAGMAVLKALAAVEAIGAGAIGGYISLVAIGIDGVLHRLEAQRGGTSTILSAPLPVEIATARHAVLMSSGPDRPAPLSQFTPGDAKVGLITGHRFPNMPGETGMPLNEEVLHRMLGGELASKAVAAVLEGNPLADAGLIALSVNGEIALGDTVLLQDFPDRGRAQLGNLDEGAVVAVLHNGIAPYRGLALVAAEIALSCMTDPPDEIISVQLTAGTPVVAGRSNAVIVDDNRRVTALQVKDERKASGRWSFGLGYRTAVIDCRGRALGNVLFESFLVADAGVLQSVDGVAQKALDVVPSTD